MIKSGEDHLSFVLPFASDALKTRADEILKKLSNADLDPQKIRAANPDDKTLSAWTDWATSQVETLTSLSEKIREESKKTATKDIPAGSTVDEMKNDVWKIRKEVQSGIDSVRDDVYKLQEVRLSPWRGIRPTQKASMSPNVPENVQELEKLATDEVQMAHDKYAETLQNVDPTPNDLLQMINEAGTMLEVTERLMLGYDRLQSASTPPKPDACSNNDRQDCESRDQIGEIAHTKSEVISRKLGDGSGSKLVFNPRSFLLCSLPSISTYHPSYLSGSSSSRVLIALRPYWEIVFWSFFGAISMSIVSIAHDYKQDMFDSRHIGKYKFRIRIAPFVTVAIIFFLSVVLFEITSSGTGGGGKITVDLSNPNIPLLIMLSFILGFFGKKSLDLLSSIWTKLFETIDSGTSSTAGKNSTTSGS